MLDRKKMEDDPLVQDVYKKDLASKTREFAASGLYAMSLFSFANYVKDIAFDLYGIIRHPNMSSEIPGSDGPAYGMLLLSVLCLAMGGVMKAQARSDSNRSMIEFVYSMNRRKD